MEYGLVVSVPMRVPLAKNSTLVRIPDHRDRDFRRNVTDDSV